MSSVPQGLSSSHYVGRRRLRLRRADDWGRYKFVQTFRINSETDALIVFASALVRRLAKQSITNSAHGYSLYSDHGCGRKN
jgi:hypothetical protein